MQFPAQPLKTEPSLLLPRYFDRMLQAFGPQHWWPARTRLEVILGAILTQNTSWRNAALALKGLRERGLISVDRLELCSRSEIETLLRPAGFFRQKARTIRNFLNWLNEKCGGSLTVMFKRSSEIVRKDLLSIQGLGPETVDAILLYAGRRPFFVADAYTRRIFGRHGLIPLNSAYSSVQDFLHRRLPRDPALFNEYHALLVEVGKRYCKRSAPACGGCPLEIFLARSASMHQKPGPAAASRNRLKQANLPVGRPGTGSMRISLGRLHSWTKNNNPGARSI